MTEGGASTPAGWYPDPQHPGQQRYWDGSSWGQTAPMAPAAPAGPPPKKGGKKWLIPLVACLGLALIAIIGGAIAAGGGDDDDDKTQVTTGGGGNAGEADEVDDVKVDSCEQDPDTGWGTANLTVTNNSSKPSTYAITIKFEDGSTSYGTASAFVDELSPGQSEQVEASTLKDFPGGTCEVVEVERLAS